MVSVAHLLKEMPKGYEAACFDTKAIQRKRGITYADDLMMLSLFHLLNGCSLTEISVIADLAKLGTVSDVAFMKRFENCNDWFLWIISNLVTDGAVSYQKPKWLSQYNILGADASDVREKGRSGRIYRLHLALDIFSMKSLQYKITTNKVGETLRNFEIKRNDLIVADRGYVSLNGIEHCLNGGGSFALRLRKNSFSLYDSAGKTINLLKHLRKLKQENTLDLNVFASGNDGRKIALRVCAMRKTPEAIAATQKRLRRKEQLKQTIFAGDTKEFNNYIVLITNLPSEILSEQVLELYRFRWQVEIYFKRMKSIMDFGELPKRRHASVMAWLNGKLMIAILIEKIMGRMDFPPGRKLGTEYLARNEADILVTNHKLY